MSPVKTVIQCDFDGTVTKDDVSFIFLDRFANSNWRQLWDEYQAGKITVAAFNSRAFAMVKADRQTLLDYMFTRGNVKIRPGFRELVSYCRQKGSRFVIISNGLIFYIEAILKDLGLKDIEVFAAESHFSPEGMRVAYIGPDGKQVNDGFKETYTSLFLSQGYRVIYVGNGISDIYPARRAYHVFATGELLRRCERLKLDCTPFADFNDIIRGLEQLPASPPSE